MIVIVTEKEIEHETGRRYMISADRAVIQVASAKDALEIIAQTSNDAAPMATFVPDKEQLGDFLTRMEDWPEINVIVLFGSFGTNAKTLSEYFGVKDFKLT